MSTEIKFEDIQVGDVLRVVAVYEGVSTQRSGTVAKRSDYGVSTVEGGQLYYCGWAGKPTFYLIDRPKPPLPTEPGTIIIAEMPNETVTLILQTDKWFSLDGEGYYSAEAVQKRPWKLAKLVEA